MKFQTAGWQLVKHFNLVLDVWTFSPERSCLRYTGGQTLGESGGQTLGGTGGHTLGGASEGSESSGHKLDSSNQQGRFTFLLNFMSPTVLIQHF